ncbi:hypothetical protein AB0A60_35605 [Streptomyces sp. NPDC046275]|uniref:hypothetical protein n=1 Tax=Streptomyces sp. NPDC046275 TaxID=3157201 RepID=UPI0033C06A9A
MRAIKVFERLLDRAGDGEHRAVLSVEGIGGNTVRVFRFAQEDEKFSANEMEAIAFTELLAVAMTGKHGAGLILRSQKEAEEVLRGWRFDEGIPVPLSAHTTHFCHTHDRDGNPIEPEAGLKFVTAPSLLE